MHNPSSTANWAHRHTAPGARVCDPQQLRQIECVRIILRLFDPTAALRLYCTGKYTDMPPSAFALLLIGQINPPVP